MERPLDDSNTRVLVTVFDRSASAMSPHRRGILTIHAALVPAPLHLDAVHRTEWLLELIPHWEGEHLSCPGLAIIPLLNYPTWV